MKYLVLSICLLSFWPAPDANAQAKETQSYDSVAYYRQYRIYRSAMKYSDPVVARMALYNMLMMNPPGANAIADSLAILYLDEGKYPSAALIAQDILAANPKSPTAQEVGAYAFEQLGLDNKALPLLESIYLRNDDIITLYKIALIQFKQGNYTESSTNFDIILGKKLADSVNLYFADKDNNEQQIPLRAAVLNMKGLMAKSQDRKEEAIKFYKQALLISPEFYLARSNLETIQK